MIKGKNREQLKEHNVFIKNVLYRQIYISTINTLKNKTKNLYHLHCITLNTNGYREVVYKSNTCSFFIYTMEVYKKF